MQKINVSLDNYVYNSYRTLLKATARRNEKYVTFCIRCFTYFNKKNIQQ